LFARRRVRKKRPDLLPKLCSGSRLGVCKRLKGHLGFVKQEKDPNGKAAVLIVDMIADFEFENGEQLFTHALPIARNIAGLKNRAVKAFVPVIYVNDNYHKWKDDFKATLRSAESSRYGKEIVSILRPLAHDYYVLKPQRSGFFGTPLDFLLESLDVSNLIVTGVTTDICVLFTAHDAYMRGYSLSVPGDCSAAVEVKDHDSIITLLARIADADTRRSDEIELVMN
jgi:nicotinamidase-related amidase